MFNVGDLIIYSSQGICCIDEICKKTYFGITKDYYVLHPIENSKLKISIPVDNDKVTMLDLVHKDEAEKIIESFKAPGIDWVDVVSQRNQIYSNIIKKGNRKEIAKIINTLIRRKREVESNGKKFNERDNDLLTFTQNIMFTELAISLDTTVETIHKKINRLIVKH